MKSVSIFKTFALGIVSISFPAAGFTQTLYVPSGTSGIGTSASGVGVGTSTPQALIDVRGSVMLGFHSTLGSPSITAGFNGQFGDPLVGGSGGFRFSKNSGTAGDKVFSSFHSNSGSEFYHEVLSLTESRFIFNAGNVGIGTSSPTRTFSVSDSSGYIARFDRTIESDGGWAQILELSTNAQPFTRFGTLGARNGGVDSFDKFWISANAASSTPWTDNHFVITGQGRVGIGTQSPSHKLSVNGTIRAKEVIVDTGWADYVFADDYELMPLSEVESHINVAKHLPGIPSASEVAQNGISVGEMQAKLLEKIEELTLHQIAQDKRVKAQESRINLMEKENRNLKNLLMTSFGQPEDGNQKSSGL